MANDTVSTEPVCEDFTIHYAGREYVIASENDYEASESASYYADPDEVPRRVLDGFVYGGRAWVMQSASPNFLQKLKDKDKAVAMLALDKVCEREAAQARSIPAELHAEVYERSRTQSDRAIALWLIREKGCRTSYASVGRLIRQLDLKEARTRQRAELEEETASLRIRLSRTLDTMMDLQADFLEQHDEVQGEPPARGTQPERQQVPTVWRMHHQSASLIERRLRVVERDLAALQRQSGDAKRPEPELTPTEVPAREVAPDEQGHKEADTAAGSDAPEAVPEESSFRRTGSNGRKARSERVRVAPLTRDDERAEAARP